MLRAFKFPFPPVKEQAQIAAHLDNRIRTVTVTQRLTDSEIRSVREYRTRFIADVVTGKLDVRAAAASLPDEPEELEKASPDADEADDNQGPADEAEAKA